VTQTNRQPEQPVEPELLLEADLGRFKAALENIRNLLLYGANLRTLTMDDLDRFDKDLREVIMGDERLRHTPHIGNFLISVDAVQVIIRNAILELNVAVNVMENETIFSQDSGRSFFICLANCQRYLSEALQQFLI
jgi:hypothetical protein